MAKPTRPIQASGSAQPGAPGQAQLIARHEQVSIVAHSGPLPQPDVIAGYEHALPGSADRIIKMAEREQEHRHRKEAREQTFRSWATFLGQIFAFLIGISGTLGGVLLVYHDKPLGGFSVFFASLATLAGIYVFGKREQAKKPALQNSSQPSKSS